MRSANLLIATVCLSESGRRVILSVIFKLPKHAALQLDYGHLRSYLAEQQVQQPTAQDVSRAVCAIRAEKLPDPKQLANAGSFFKNPVISAEHAQQLQASYPDIVSFAQADGQVKLAAGWLIEQAGWKGVRQGDAGVHAKQALVLVNYGEASGQQILELAEHIKLISSSALLLSWKSSPMSLLAKVGWRRLNN